MAAISMSASTSSFELNTGNLWVRMDSSMMPADQTSIAGNRQRTLADPRERFSRTNGLVRAFQEDFGCSEPSRPGTIRLDRRPLVVLGKADPAFAKPGALPSIVERLLNRSSLGRFLLLPR